VGVVVGVGVGYRTIRYDICKIDVDILKSMDVSDEKNRAFEYVTFF
jgi:hypothetical protein